MNKRLYPTCPTTRDRRRLPQATACRSDPAHPLCPESARVQCKGFLGKLMGNLLPLTRQFGLQSASMVVVASLLQGCSSASDPQIASQIKLLREEDGATRWRAIGALSTFGPAAVPALISALSDSNPNVRWSASGALALIGSAAGDALPNLRKVMADDADPAVRQIAQMAAHEIGGDEVAEAPQEVNLLTGNPGMSLTVKPDKLMERFRLEIRTSEPTH